MALPSFRQTHYAIAGRGPTWMQRESGSKGCWGWNLEAFRLKRSETGGLPSKDGDLVCKHGDFSCNCLTWSLLSGEVNKGGHQMILSRVFLIASPWSWGDSINTSCTVGLFCGSPLNHRLDSHLPHLYFLEKTWKTFSKHIPITFPKSCCEKCLWSKGDFISKN